MTPKDITLTTGQQQRCDELISQVRLLAYCAPDAFGRVATVVDTEMKRAQAALDPGASSPAAKAIAASCATSLKADTVAAVSLKTETDRRIIATIPQPERGILERLCHSEGEIVAAWREHLQKLGAAV